MTLAKLSVTLQDQQHAGEHAEHETSPRTPRSTVSVIRKPPVDAPPAGIAAIAAPGPCRHRNDDARARAT